MRELRGTGASPGVVIGPAFVVSREIVTLPEIDEPTLAFARAVSTVHGDLVRLGEEATARGRNEAATVLQAQAMMATDPMLTEAVAERLEDGDNLQTAITISASSISELLAATADEYLAARSADVTEVADRILRCLAGAEAGGLDSMTTASVVVATALTAAETAQLDPERVLGFATAEGGATSHVAIIARSLGIPAVVGAEGLVSSVTTETLIAIDGDTGEVVLDPDKGRETEFLARAARHQARRSAASAYVGRRVRFSDRDIAVAANVGGSDDIARAVAARADGVGLYRTEFLFLDRSDPPTESEQVAFYGEAATAFTDPVVVRTFDIGGDKPAPYLDLPPEENPFLGERGVRIYDQNTLFRTQVRALLRATHHGDLWIMIPMVATVGDLVRARQTIEDIRQELVAEGHDTTAPKVGAMIEVPSAALLAHHLANHADFLSIGTNDLTQYTLAADRTNPRLARYSDAAHPAVLRLCHETAGAASASGISVSVCGEAAADPVLAVLFAALGISKLSVSPPSVNLVKAAVAETDPVAAADIAAQALAAPDAETVREIAGPLVERVSG
jgi:phosphoenolpyruvate-protein phosphotransferase